ncbi:MAG TPA: hypothetical protein VK550_05505 [Polyangiaceae bacterium]|nr:hypothetical protein [Polyangiaceae bacterium]
MQHGRVALLSIALAGAASCNRASPAARYDLLIRVSAGPGRPLAGARVLFQGKSVGTSKESGAVKLSVEGTEGEVFPFTVACPEGYRSPARPIDVTLRRLADPGAPPEFSVSCMPLTRSVVVAVRADQGPNLPVVYLGQEVARTDSAGAAHVLLTLAPGEEFELMLDTANAAGERLRPQKPTGKFSVKNEDEILTFHVPFTVEVEKRAAPPRSAPRPPGPIRL